MPRGAEQRQTLVLSEARTQPRWHPWDCCLLPAPAGHQALVSPPILFKPPKGFLSAGLLPPCRHSHLHELDPGGLILASTPTPVPPTTGTQRSSGPGGAPRSRDHPHLMCGLHLLPLLLWGLHLLHSPHPPSIHWATLEEHLYAACPLLSSWGTNFTKTGLWPENTVSRTSWGHRLVNRHSQKHLDTRLSLARKGVQRGAPCVPSPWGGSEAQLHALDSRAPRARRGRDWPQHQGWGLWEGGKRLRDPS